MPLYFSITEIMLRTPMPWSGSSVTGIWLWNRGSLKYVFAILMHILLFFSNNLIVIRRLLSFETALSHCFIQEFIAFSKAFVEQAADEGKF